MNLKNKSFRVSFIVGLSFCLIAIVLFLLNYISLGLSLFLFLPLAIGVSSGMLPDLKQAIYGTLFSLLIFSVFLVLSKVEGIICVVMALPILLLFAWIGRLIGKRFRKKDDEITLKSTLTPFLIFLLASFLEVFSGNNSTYAEVTNTVIIKGSSEEVYQNIIAVDTVDVDRNFLQKIGLPTPRKCVLTEEKVGGLRLCEFEEGRITEKITELRKNEYLKMDVTKCELGKQRNWLKFHEDIYSIRPIGKNQTSITRTTTYSSALKPRVYWKFIENLTISSEQDFVFRNLIKDVEQ